MPGIHKSLAKTRQLIAIAKGDEYDILAANLQNELITTWDLSTKDVLNDIIRDLKSGKTFGKDELDLIHQKLRLHLGPEFANKIAGPLYTSNINTYSLGFYDVSTSGAFNLVDNNAIKAMHNNNLYWIDSYYDRLLSEEIAQFGAQAIEEGLSWEDAGKLFKEQFNGLYGRSTAYWEGFANNVVTRSREFGHIDGYEDIGVQYFKFVAVNDHRTSNICRTLNGRLFPLKWGQKIRDGYVKAKTPQKAMKVSRWYSYKQLMSMRKIPREMAIPPVHYNCRSRTVVAKEAEVDAWKDSSLSKYRVKDWLIPV